MSATILRAYKTELDPNNKQRTAFAQCSGIARFTYNWALADHNERYSQGLKTNMYEQKRRFNEIKGAAWPWMSEQPYALQEKAFADLDAAFKHFYRRVKAGETPGYPRFKKRHSRRSFSLRGVKVEHDKVRLSRIGWIRLKEHGYIPTDAEYGTYATISEQAGRWFVSVLVKEPLPEPVDGNGVIGVDIGIKSLAVCSDGAEFPNPRALYAQSRKIARLNRELSRRKRGGQNWTKTKHRLQQAYAKATNIRRYALHQVSDYVTAKTKPRQIVLEDLSPSNMVKNRHLAKAISDASFAELRRQVEYKAEHLGIEVVIADRWFPSSKTCSECGSIKAVLRLSDRTYVCETCGCVIDRDLNAARNLAALAG